MFCLNRLQRGGFGGVGSGSRSRKQASLDPGHLWRQIHEAYWSGTRLSAKGVGLQ